MSVVSVIVPRFLWDLVNIDFLYVIYYDIVILYIILKGSK